MWLSQDQCYKINAGKYLERSLASKYGVLMHYHHKTLFLASNSQRLLFTRVKRCRYFGRRQSPSHFQCLTPYQNGVLMQHYRKMLFCRRHNFQGFWFANIRIYGYVGCESTFTGRYYSNKVFSRLAPYQRLIAISNCTIKPSFMQVSHFAHVHVNLLLCRSAMLTECNELRPW